MKPGKREFQILSSICSDQKKKKVLVILFNWGKDIWLCRQYKRWYQLHEKLLTRHDSYTQYKIMCLMKEYLISKPTNQNNNTKYV